VIEAAIMRLINSTNFSLIKQYFDCIDDDGNCFILYWAELRCCFIHIVYSGLIFSDSKNICTEKATLKKCKRPLLDHILQFNQPALRINGCWNRVSNPLSLILYKDASGQELIWDCHHPKAHTTINYNDKTYEGLGYAETLHLPIKPWKLPIDELRWGRFLSEQYSIIWIHWKGAYPVNIIFCNGVAYHDASFEEKKIIFSGGTLTLLFEDIIILRQGKLTKILTKMPWLKIIFHSRILNTVEIKYKAKSSLSDNTKVIANGWSLFETVNWGK